MRFARVVFTSALFDLTTIESITLGPSMPHPFGGLRARAGALGTRKKWLFFNDLQGIFGEAAQNAAGLYI
jgi:hypothetical protein